MWKFFKKKNDQPAAALAETSPDTPSNVALPESTLPLPDSIDSVVSDTPETIASSSDAPAVHDAATQENTSLNAKTDAEVVSEAATEIKQNAAKLEDKLGALRKLTDRVSALRSSKALKGGEVGEAPELTLPKVPIRVIVGYLPGVGERDALEFSLGVAAKHFDQESITYYEVFPYESGFVYELHEGGSGFAFMPEVIKRLHDAEQVYRIEKMAALKAGKPVPEDQNKVRSFVIPCATRLVQVSKTHEGLTCILLPESTRLQPDYTLLSKEQMRPALDKKTGFLVFGAGVFITGFFAMLLAGFVFREQPYTAVQHEKVSKSFQQTVYGKYLELRDRVGDDQVLKQVVYQNGVWRAPIIKPRPMLQVAPVANPSMASAPAGAAPIQPVQTASAPLASAPVGLPSLPQGAVGKARPVPPVVQSDMPRDSVTDKELKP